MPDPLQTNEASQTLYNRDPLQRREGRALLNSSAYPAQPARRDGVSSTPAPVWSSTRTRDHEQFVRAARDPLTATVDPAPPRSASTSRPRYQFMRNPSGVNVEAPADGLQSLFRWDDQDPDPAHLGKDLPPGRMAASGDLRRSHEPPALPGRTCLLSSNLLPLHHVTDAAGFLPAGTVGRVCEEHFSNHGAAPLQLPDSSTRDEAGNPCRLRLHRSRQKLPGQQMLGQRVLSLTWSSFPVAAWSRELWLASPQ